MARITLTFLALFAAPLAMAAPLTLDNSTLLTNGQTAQQLNSEFKTLSANDSCTTDQQACIGGNFATCTAAAWQVQKCPKDKQCFALPNVRSPGAFVACTGQRNAESIISSTGVQGGVANASNSSANVAFPMVNGTGTMDYSDSSANSTSTDGDDDNCDDDGNDGADSGAGQDRQGGDDGDSQGDGSDSGNDGDDHGKNDNGKNGDDGDDGSVVTITSFITIPVSGTATFATTQTIAPSDASSILASATPITTPASASQTDSAAASATASASSAAVTAAAGAGNVQIGVTAPIQLTPRPLTANALATPASSASSAPVAAVVTSTVSNDSGYS